MDQAFMQQLQVMGGSAAKRLLAANMDTNVLRNNAVLRKDEWIELDRAIIVAAQDRLVGVADLLSRGLTLTIPNGLGKTILESENVSDMRDASVSMSGVTRGENDAVNFELVGLPLPLIHKEYQIDIRKLMASRSVGEPLDATQAALSSRKVADKQEDILFNGLSSFTSGGRTLFGYTDFPQRNTGSITDWSLVGTSGQTILAETLAMKQALLDDKMFGPYFLYVPKQYETKLDSDFSDAKGDLSIMQRLLMIRNLEAIQVSDKLADNNVVMVQMTTDVVRMVQGLPLTNVEWDELGGMVFHFKVMTISIPQLRTDQAGNSGIAHFSV